RTSNGEICSFERIHVVGDAVKVDIRMSHAPNRADFCAVAYGEVDARGCPWIENNISITVDLRDQYDLAFSISTCLCKVDVVVAEVKQRCRGRARKWLNIEH